MKKRLILLLFLFAIALPSLGQAQTVPKQAEPTRPLSPREEVKSRKVIINQYQIDPISGTRALVKSWPWLNYQSYYRLQSELAFHPVVEARVLAKYAPTGTLYMVSETDRFGNLLRQTLLSKGIINRTYIERRETLYYDTQELWKYLAAERQKVLTNKALPPTLDGALMTIRSADPDTGKPVIWPIMNKEDVLYIASFLHNIPKLSPIEEINVRGNFDAPEAFHIERLSNEFKDMPLIFDVSDYQIRFVNNIPHSLIVYDDMNLEGQILGQEKLYDDLRAKGQQNPQPIY